MAQKKKSKKTLSLASFLHEEKSSSWADEVDGLNLSEQFHAPKTSGAETDVWRNNREDPQQARPFQPKKEVPDKPPFTLYVGNVTFDTSESDVKDFFGPGCTNVRVVINRESGTSKGCCYAEFATKADILAALECDGHNLKGRKIRVDVAESRGNDRDRDRGGNRRDGPPSDWDRTSMGTGVVEGRSQAPQRDNAGDRGFGRGEASNFGRDAMGSEQPAGGRREPASFGRDTMGSEQPVGGRREPANFGRDTMGSEQPIAASTRGPPSAFNRDAMGTEQPVTRMGSSTGNLNRNAISDVRNADASPRAEPINWRDAPASERPAFRANDEAARTERDLGRGRTAAPTMLDRGAMGTEQQRPAAAAPPPAPTSTETTENPPHPAPRSGAFVARSATFDRTMMGSSAPPAESSPPRAPPKRVTPAAAAPSQAAAIATTTATATATTLSDDTPADEVPVVAAAEPKTSAPSNSGWRTSTAGTDGKSHENEKQKATAETTHKPSKAPTEDKKKKAAQSANSNAFGVLKDVNTASAEKPKKLNKKAKARAAAEANKGEDEETSAHDDTANQDACE